MSIAFESRYELEELLSVLDSHIYVDEAVSAATDDRFGRRQMLAAAVSAANPFDVVLVDDTSRMSRTLKHYFTIHDELCLAGVRVVFVSRRETLPTLLDTMPVRSSPSSGTTFHTS